ncbi:MAG: glutamine-hydrolyzing GMP synthase [Planctomycetota bacterium]|nr:MAG: glutamine-hydrolyzing GMP synthase [Planctomycetota bacterium]
MAKHQFVAVLDFGSQYAQLIARRIREHSVYCEIRRCDTPAAELKKKNLIGIVMTGGPRSVYADGAPEADPEILKLGVPILGICYGMQLGCKYLGAEVKPAESREYGHVSLKVNEPEKLLAGVSEETSVWMSHGDMVKELPEYFVPLASTPTCRFAAVKHKNSNFYGVQFHPEVHHTPDGRTIFRNFLYDICGAAGDWKMEDFINEEVEKLRRQIGDESCVLGLSGGVDSTVVAMLLDRAIGEKLHCIFVDNGVLRQNEAGQVVNTFKSRLRNFHFIDAADRFLDLLGGVSDQKKKRRIIGDEFIHTFMEKARELGAPHFLAQGTLYPDVIETTNPHGGPTDQIKPHHNVLVRKLVEELNVELVEPLAGLFKDEVRQVGLKLGLPRDIVMRHPFPGPGLAVRCLGEVTRERLAVLRQADAIVYEEIKKAGLYEDVWQAFAVHLPVRSVGVMGDEGTYENVIVIRVVESVDAMTADWARLPYDLLQTMSSRIINEVRGVNRVVYDISQKPPSTIEWE